MRANSHDYRTRKGALPFQYGSKVIQTKEKPCDLAAGLRRKYRGGWGDRLHHFLLPFALWMDRHFATELSHCAACRRRRQKLNGLEAWLKRWKRRS